MAGGGSGGALTGPGADITTYYSAPLNAERLDHSSCTYGPTGLPDGYARTHARTHACTHAHSAQIHLRLPGMTAPPRVVLNTTTLTKCCVACCQSEHSCSNFQYCVRVCACVCVCVCVRTCACIDLDDHRLNRPCTHLFLNNSYAYLFKEDHSWCCMSSWPVKVHNVSPSRICFSRGYCWDVVAGTAVSLRGGGAGTS